MIIDVGGKIGKGLLVCDMFVRVDMITEDMGRQWGLEDTHAKSHKERDRDFGHGVMIKAVTIMCAYIYV